MVEFTFFILGSLAATVVPTIHSVWRETRFAPRGQIILGGFASIIFAIIYVSDPNFPSNFEYLKFWALPIFVSFGIISIIVGLQLRERERWWTLFFSKKQFGALGISFLYPILFEELPPKIIQLNLPNVIEFGIVLLGVVNVASLILFAIRNR